MSYCVFAAQDIQQCSGPLELLDELNAKGRAKIAVLKSSIEKLSSLAETEVNEKERAELLSTVDSYKKQLNVSLAAFRKANVVSACVIDKLAREDLLSMSEERQNFLRRRHDKQSLTNASGQVTDKLLNIARHLAEMNRRSADTLDTLRTYRPSYGMIGENANAILSILILSFSISDILGQSRQHQKRIGTPAAGHSPVGKASRKVRQARGD